VNYYTRVNCTIQEVTAYPMTGEENQTVGPSQRDLFTKILFCLQDNSYNENR